MGNRDKTAPVGWIKLHRSLLQSSLFANERKLRVFIWCLLRANPRPTDVRIGNQTVRLMRGQFITSRDKAAAELGGLSGSAVRRWLKQLAGEQRIRLQANSKYTLVTVTNYGVYQGKAAGSGQESGRRSALSADSKVNTEEEYSKKKEEEKNALRAVSPPAEPAAPEGWDEGEWND